MNVDYFANIPARAEPRSALISIALDLPNVRVLDTQINDQGEYIITVESTEEGSKCKHCQKQIEALHQRDEWLNIRHLSILGRSVYIRLRPKRYNCARCARQKGKKKVTSTQALSWHQSQSPHTRTYEEHVLLGLVNSTIKDVSLKENLGYEAVVGIVKRNISTKVDWEQVARLDTLGIDEISLKKGHQDYVVPITARLDDGQVKILTVLPNRKKKTVKKFLRSIPQRLRETIHTVCLDMWKHYITAVEDVFGDEVDITVDRYHVAKKYREAADKLRKKELARLKKALPEAEYKELKGIMWAYRKKAVDLSPAETDLLKQFFAYSPDAQKAYNLREDLTAIFAQALSKEDASEKIKQWCNQVQESGLTCFDAFLTTLDNHFGYITNYFIKRLNSGFVEGFNNKIKVIKRRCYGIFKVDHLFQRIFLDIEGYRLFTTLT